MSEVVIIAAVAKNNVIGKAGKIPWHIKEDFQHFKSLTMGYPVIMGRNTFESLTVKPLPGRENVVLSRNKFSYPGIVVKSSMQEALDYCKKHDKTFIIGGASVYEQGLGFADKLELTQINQDYEGDTYFPEVNFDEWQLDKKEDKGNYSFNTYVRKKE
jgi:dihydrofolate reductase